MSIRSRAHLTLVVGVLMAVAPAQAGPLDPPVESVWESPFKAMDLNNDGTHDIVSIQKTGQDPPGFPSRGRVLARNGKSGGLLWRTPVWTIARWKLIDTDGEGPPELAILEGGPPATSLSISLGGILGAGAAANGLHLVDLTTGTSRWDYGPPPTGLFSIGDADGDGHDDLVVTDVNKAGLLPAVWSQRVRTLRGTTGDVIAEASFAAAQDRPPAVRPVQDISGDGIGDLLVLGNLAGSSETTLTSTALNGSVHWSFEVPDGSGLGANPILESPSGRNILLTEGEVGTVARDGADGSRLWTRSDLARAPEIVGDADGDGTSDMALDDGVYENDEIRGNSIQVISGSTGSDLYYKEFMFAVPEGHHLSIFISGVNEGPVVPTGDFDGDDVDDLLFYWGVARDGEMCCESYKTIAISQRQGTLLWEIDSSTYPFKLTRDAEGQDIDADGTQDLVWYERSQAGGTRFTYHFVNGATFEPIWSATSTPLPSSPYVVPTAVVAAELTSEQAGPEIAFGIAYEVTDGDDYRYRTRTEAHSKAGLIWATDSQ